MPDTETIKALKVVIKNREGVPVLPMIETTDAVEEGNNTPVTSHGVKTFLNSFTPNNPPGGGGGKGRQIGDIFHHIDKVAPAGAYVLDGSTIADCKKRHPEFWAWLNNLSRAYMVVTSAAYDALLKETGTALAFVVSENGDVRLPTWFPGVPLGMDIPVRGTGMALGFTDGTKNYGMYEDTSGGGTRAQVVNLNTSLYGVAAGTPYSAEEAANNRLAQGITLDPAKSGMVAQAVYDKTNYRHGVYCIHVYDEVTPSSKLDADAFTEYVERLMAEMRLQAKVDLTNVTGTADFVVESKVNDDGSWYRLYKSGWVEQGGVYIGEKTDKHIATVTFLKKMKGTTYFPTMQRTTSSSEGSTYPPRDFGCFNLTVDGMSFVAFASDRKSFGTRWKVEGQAAEVPQWGSTNV